MGETFSHKGNLCLSSPWSTICFSYMLGNLEYEWRKPLAVLPAWLKGIYIGCLKFDSAVFLKLFITVVIITIIYYCQNVLSVIITLTQEKRLVVMSKSVCDKRRLQTCRPQTCRLADLQTRTFADLHIL